MSELLKKYRSMRDFRILRSFAVFAAQDDLNANTVF